MISEMLWSSAVFFAAVLGFAVLTMRLAVHQLVLPGLAAPIALAASSLASTGQGADAEITLAAAALRFIPAALVFGYFNPDGRAHFAGLGIFWTWIWLEVIFVLSFREQPAFSNFVSGPIPYYLILPAVSAFLMSLLKSIVQFLRI